MTKQDPKMTSFATFQKKVKNIETINHTGEFSPKANGAQCGTHTPRSVGSSLELQREQWKCSW